MKLTLKVYNHKEKNFQTIENDGRWNCEKEFDIPERLILKLIEEIIDNLVESQSYYLNRVGSLITSRITYGEINEVVRPARSWKKIHILISDQGYETSRFTRIDLFIKLMDNKKVKKSIKEKIQDIEQKKSQTQLAPPKI